MAAGAAGADSGDRVTVPDGYRTLRCGRVRAVVRADLAGALAPWLLGTPLALPGDSVAIAGGRGGAWRLTLPGGLRAVLRCYRRGGLVARVVRETYLGFVGRPFHELEVTAEARRRGVAAPEVLAARVEGGLLYRGAIVTAEVPGAVTLLEAMRRASDDAGRRALAARAGSVVAHMHRAGVWHADLNLTNLLVPVGDAPGLTILDLDRARLGSRPLPPRACRQNLARLARSLRKLDPEGRLAAPEDIAAFHAAYATSAGATCAS
jgi:3-deoxy-D-manno-octulosonic acid kinase